MLFSLELGIFRLAVFGRQLAVRNFAGIYFRDKKSEGKGRM